ncbi:MAG: methyltransferase domain-containing protein [Betaproteobacteria bacterium]|nr:methyltransferase domain-containing protein [Betaproteobacteria bacterium]
MSLDWTRLTDDPNNGPAKQAVLRHLLAARRVHTDRGLLEFVEALVDGRTVLDIGVVSHSARYFDQPDWRHGHVARRARRCVGVDILAPLVDELNARGFDVRCVDATSEADLGERFEVVFIGDVLEHVDNTVALLRFAARHLAPGGRIYATTPNPFSRKFFRRFRRDGTAIVNLDHMAWITPTQAMEIARRAGIALAGYHLIKKLSPAQALVKRIAWRFTPLEYSFPDFVYEFAPHG